MPILTNNVDNSWGKNFPFFKLGRPGQKPLRKSFIMKENNHRLVGLIRWFAVEIYREAPQIAWLHQATKPVNGGLDQ